MVAGNKFMIYSDNNNGYWNNIANTWTEHLNFASLYTEDQKSRIPPFNHNVWIPEMETTVEEMRYQIAESEWEGLKDRDLKQILMNGCPGWNAIPALEIIETWNGIYGGDDE